MDEQALDAAFTAGCRLPPRWFDAHPGEQLRAVRERLGVSQRCLADDSGVPQSLISRFERGADARFSTVQRLFQALGCLAALALMMGCEEAEDLAAEAMERRKDRQRDGLMARSPRRFR